MVTNTPAHLIETINKLVRTSRQLLLVLGRVGQVCRRPARDSPPFRVHAFICRRSARLWRVSIVKAGHSIFDDPRRFIDDGYA
jgi:hypothetical protein